MPVPGKTPTRQRASLPAPNRYSPYTPASTSLSTTTGHLNSASSASPNLKILPTQIGRLDHAPFIEVDLPRTADANAGQLLPSTRPSFIASRMVSMIRSSPALAPSAPFVFRRRLPNSRKSALNTAAEHFGAAQIETDPRSVIASVSHAVFYCRNEEIIATTS